MLSGGESREPGGLRVYSWYCHPLGAAHPASDQTALQLLSPTCHRLYNHSQLQPQGTVPLVQGIIFLIRNYYLSYQHEGVLNFLLNGKGSPTIIMFTNFTQCFQCYRINFYGVSLARFALSHVLGNA